MMQSKTGTNWQWKRHELGDRSGGVSEVVGEVTSGTLLETHARLEASG